MSLNERHRWCINKMLEAFGPELTSDAVQAFIRNEQNLQKFNAFFKGDASNRLFIYYQPQTVETEVCFLILSAH
jgi:5-enolpyruvylshikimate-3-phosphate synthase